MPTLSLHKTTQAPTPFVAHARRDGIGSTYDDEALLERAAVLDHKSIPSAYASACGSPAAFASACSCIGVSAVTTTVEADSTTTTHTVIRTLAMTGIRPSLGNHTVSLNSTTGRWNNGTSTSQATLSSKLKGGAGLTTGKETKPVTSHLPTDSTSVPPSISKAAPEDILSDSQSPQGTHATAHATNSAQPGPQTFKNISSVNSASASAHLNSSGATNSSSHLPNKTGSTQSSVATSSVGSVTAIHYVNTTTRLGPVSSSSSSARLNASVAASQTNGTALGSSFAVATSLSYASTAHWNNHSLTSASVNFTSGKRINTSAPPSRATSALNTTQRLNTTRLSASMTRLPMNSTRLPMNMTTTRWMNSTMRANYTSTRWQNVSTTTPTPTATADLSCGETSASFALQVAQPGGMFDSWYVHLIGDGLLFTALASSASFFSIGQTGHLCAVGQLDANGRPYLASIGTHDNSSAVWMLSQRVIKDMSNDYGALNCTAGSTLSCAGNSTSHWIGCGLELDISTDGGSTVPYDGLNCTSIGLNIVASGGGNATVPMPGSGTTLVPGSQVSSNYIASATYLGPAS